MASHSSSRAAGLSLGTDVSSDFAAKGLGWARAIATQSDLYAVIIMLR